MSKKSKQEYISAIRESDFSIHTLSIPITFGYNFFSSSIPLLFAGFEYGYALDAFEKQNYYFNSCTACFGNENIEIDPKYYHGWEVDLVKNKNNYLNLLLGLSHTVILLGQNIDIKFLYNFLIEPITLDYEFLRAKKLEMNNFEIIFGYKF